MYTACGSEISLYHVLVPNSAKLIPRHSLRTSAEEACTRFLTFSTASLR